MEKTDNDFTMLWSVECPIHNPDGSLDLRHKVRRHFGMNKGDESPTILEEVILKRWK